LAVHELGAGSMDTGSGTVKSLDCLAVEGLGRGAFAQQRQGSCPRPKRPVGADRCQVFEVTHGATCHRASVASGTCLAELEAGPAKETAFSMRASALRDDKGILVAAEAVVQDGIRVVGKGARPLHVVETSLLDGGGGQLRSDGLPAPPCGEQERREQGRRV